MSSETDKISFDLQHDGAAAVNGGQPQQLLPNNSGDVAAAAHQASPSAVTQIKLTKSEQDTKPPGQDQEGTQFDIHTWLNCPKVLNFTYFHFKVRLAQVDPVLLSQSC